MWTHAVSKDFVYYTLDIQVFGGEKKLISELPVKILTAVISFANDKVNLR